MVHSVGYNDAVLFFSLLYSCVDLWCEWDSFDTCARPVHHWLLVSYACVLGFRATHILGTWSQEANPLDGRSFLLELRHKGAVAQALSRFVWLLAVPFFSLWTLLGSSWLWSVRAETPQCMPTETHFWFAAFWLGLSYVWISIYAALGTVAATLEWRVRRAEGDLRQIEDADVISRWGQVSRLSGYQELPTSQGQGLAPADIRRLGEATLAFDEEAKVSGELECSICLTSFEAGDKVRRLPNCSHTFHKSCIDLWLLRSADCPLCKRGVVCASSANRDR
jgi:hypothetical protein